MAMAAVKRKGAGTPAARGKAPTATGEAEEDLFVTTFRIWRSQWDALRREAMQRALAGETGDRRPDASKIVREAIDEWLAKRK
jgi:hypothetical protein